MEHRYFLPRNLRSLSRIFYLPEYSDLENIENTFPNKFHTHWVICKTSKLGANILVVEIYHFFLSIFESTTCGNLIMRLLMLHRAAALGRLVWDPIYLDFPGTAPLRFALLSLLVYFLAFVVKDAVEKLNTNFL